MTLQQMIDFLTTQIASKRQWLDEFSEGRRKRPDWEIVIKRQECENLIAVRAYLMDRRDEADQPNAQGKLL